MVWCGTLNNQGPHHSLRCVTFYCVTFYSSKPCKGLWSRVSGFGFRVSGLHVGFRVWVLGFRVWILGFARVQNSGFRDEKVRARLEKIGSYTWLEKEGSHMQGLTGTGLTRLEGHTIEGHTP